MSLACSIARYHIVSDRDGVVVSKEVERLLNEGLNLYGDLQIREGLYIQVLFGILPKPVSPDYIPHKPSP